MSFKDLWKEAQEADAVTCAAPLHGDRVVGPQQRRARSSMTLSRRSGSGAHTKRLRPSPSLSSDSDGLDTVDSAPIRPARYLIRRVSNENDHQQQHLRLN